MRISFVVILAIVLMSVQVHATKNILYVTAGGTDSTCSQLSAEDSLLCMKLTNLAYGVRVINEQHIVSNSQLWQDYSNWSNMIFIGNVSLSMVNGSQNQFAFCGNLNSKLSANRPLFSAFSDNRIQSGGIRGCALYTASFLPLVKFFGADVNNCTASSLKVKKAGYITEDYNVGDNVVFYTSPDEILVHNETNDGWFATVDCSPGGLPVKLYPAINTSFKGAFWGLTVPQKYTADAWKIFEKTVRLVLNDTIIRKLSESNLTSDKDSYKPLETSRVDFYTISQTSQANLTVMKPDGSPEFYGSLTQINSSYWSKNYSFPRVAANGTYMFQVSAAAGSDIGLFNKSVDVIPYKILATLDKTSYFVNQTILVSIQRTDSYGPLNATYVFNETAPDGKKTIISKVTTDSILFNTTYQIPSNAKGGTHLIDIYINDSDGRTLTKELSFIVKASNVLSVNPPTWYQTVSLPGTLTKGFVINNTGDSAINSIDLTAYGNASMSLSLSFIGSLNSGETRNFTATVNVLQPGRKSGTISVASEDSAFLVDVAIDFSLGASIDFLTATPTFLTEVTIPDRTTQQNITLDNIGAIDGSGLVYNVSSDLAGIVSISNLPTVLSATSERQAIVNFNTAGKTPQVYSGQLTINSSIGSEVLTITVDVLGDLVSEADNQIASLEALLPSINNLEKQKKDVSSIKDLYNTTRSLLDQVKTDYQAGDYVSAKTGFDTAVNDISSLESQITALLTVKPPGNSIGIIWTIAEIVILIIIGVTAYRYKDKIKEFVNKILKKEQPQEQPEYYYSEEEYRRARGEG